MTVIELIDYLKFCDPNSQVRIATQPNWPFEYSVENISAVVLDEDEYNEEGDPEETVYISVGNQLGYLPSVVKEEIGW